MSTGNGGKPRQLTAAEAKQSLVHRLAPRVDRLRQRTAVRMGLRPYNVSLIWEKWSGAERGEGVPSVVKRLDILPTPKVEDLSGLALNPFSAGLLPVGSVRITRISALLTSDQLMGRMVPVEHEDHIPEPYEFFYEIVEDGRGDPNPKRLKFRPMSNPFRRAGSVDWIIILERVSEDRNRDGENQIGTDTE